VWESCKLLYLFEDFTLDTDRRELRRDGVLTAVEPQVFDLLSHLIGNRERVISKDGLLTAVWKGRIVSEATLDSRINAARRAVGDSGEQQRLIKTVPRKGVRFVGLVQILQPNDQSGREMHHSSTAFRPPDGAAHRPRPPPLPDRPSIAVLPFTNVGGEAEQDYFADGMADEIITALSRCRWLFVIARNSSFTYKGKVADVRRIGRELGVRYVLEGSVRRAGSRLRISGQLVSAETGALLWADRFEGELSDVFDLQDRVSEGVVGAIEPSLQRAEIRRLEEYPKPRLDAYDLLLRGQQLESELTVESLTEALRCLREAITLDPCYAPALGLAAYCHAEMHFQGWSRSAEDSSEGLRLAWRAIELGRDDANVLWMAAFAVWTLAQDGPRSKELLYRSLQANPNSPMALTITGWVEAAMGDPYRAIELIERARRLSPRDPREWFMSTGMAIARTCAGKYGEAVTWAEKALVQNRRFAPALRQLAFALIMIGQRERATSIVQELLLVEPGFSLSLFKSRVPFGVESPNSYWDKFSRALRAAGLPE
jgi:TolB-like protein/tetratricopeptide (TPR) repeat protein